MKPIGKSQGKGIFLFNKLQQIQAWKNDFRWKPESPQAEPYIVQRYIINPLLIGGKKFDMRIYVLVTSYRPLKVSMHLPLSTPRAARPSLLTARARAHRQPRSRSTCTGTGSRASPPSTTATRRTTWTTSWCT